ncbi:MAG: hypothetical protein LBD46_04540, partial [Endomicrobium sp.]|nr:hypothetical protein [Endomicrobium sp.]
MLNLFKSLKFTKFVSLFTVLCFTVSNFTSNGFAASPAAVVAGAQNINASAALNPENFVIPFNIGRITDSVNFNTNRLIVQIQDLHAHEETQRNIASILSFLDAHYKINNIYVEGASGQVDTSWLADIKDESLKGSILNSLVSKGILTGSELFSITSGKTKILKGIEDKKTYLENFQRLITIDSKKEEIKELFPPLKEILAYLSDSIYSNENKKIDRVIKRYKDGKISFGKYFAYMLKKAKSQKVYFGFYPSIILLSQITDVQNKLDKNKINSQIESLMNDIKNNYSYGQYKELIEGSSSPETQGIFYFKLANFYNKSADKNKYKELGKFLQFINLNQEINPLDLVSEERSLIWEIKNNAAQTKKEKELIFLSSFLDIIEAFLDNKISYVEYKHIQRELPKFKKLWTKYTRMSEVPGLAQYFPLFKEFYKVNEDRNNIFIKEINGKIPQKSEEVLTFSKDMVMTNVSGLLQNAKEIDIVITGGFHTHDVSRILQNAHQSYLVITPNVTQGAAEADRLFTEDVMRKAQYMPANAFQKALLTAVASENFQQLTNSDDKTIIGIFFQKSIIDALVSKEAEEKGLDKEEVSKYLKDMEFLKGVLELADELKTAIKNKGITLELTDIKVTDKGEGYRITANGNEYIVSDKGVEDADQYNVKEANIYGIAGIITGAIVAATSVFGIVASVSIVAPVIAVLGLSV